MATDEIARQSVRGTFVLFIGSLLSTAINAAAVILIARLLGPSGYGTYTLVFVIPGLLELLAGLGVNAAVLRYSAYYISAGRPQEARRFTKNAISFLSLTGIGLTIANFLLASTLTSLVLHRPALAPYVQFVSLYILGSAIFQMITSAMIGWGSMGLAGLSQVLQSVVRVVAAPVLIVLGFGVFGAIAGQVASFLFAGLFGILILFMTSLRGPSDELRHFAEDVREIVSYGLPVFSGTLMYGLATYFVTIILAAIASNEVVGFYQVAVNFTVPISLMSSAAANTLFAAFARIDGVGGDIQAALSHAIKYVAFLITPIIVFLISSSNELVRIFYGASFLPAAPFLELLAASYLPISLGYSVIPMFFNGLGRTRLTLFMNLIGAVVLAMAAPVFAVQLRLGVSGLIFSLFVSYLSTLIAGAILARKYTEVILNANQIAKILFVSFLSLGGTLLVHGASYPDLLILLLHLLLFLGLYLTVAPLVGAINETDVNTLGPALNRLSLVGRLVDPIVCYERLLMSLTENKRSDSNG